MYQPTQHVCEENVLVVREKHSNDPWLKIRERKNHRVFSGSYIMCNSVVVGGLCRYGEDNCSFAHNKWEQLLWTMEKDEEFNISEFIIQSRSKSLDKGYSIADLKLDISQLYIKTGLKNMGMVFLMTDAQVADEKFLVLINDLLASGEIPDLFPDDEIENIINGVRNEVKGLGMEDSRENCWRFFIEKVRRTLKVSKEANEAREGRTPCSTINSLNC